MCKKLLEDNKIDFKIVDYLKNPLTKTEIKKILSNLDGNLIEIVRDSKFKNENKKIS